MITSQWEMIWYRRKTFWIAIAGFGMFVPIALAILVIAVRVDDFASADRWYAAQNLVTTIGGIIAMIIGAVMGGIDHQNGMSRYVALTGTWRPGHALGRLAGAVLTWLVMITVSTLVAALAMIAIRGWPGELDQPVQVFLSFALPGLTYVLISFGLARLIGSAGFAIGICMGVLFLIEPILNAVPKVGEWWSEVSLKVATERLKLEVFDMSSVDENAGFLLAELFDIQSGLQAFAIVVLWTGIAVAAGILLDLRRDL